MKELKQWQEVYWSDYSIESAKTGEIFTFLCMDWERYICKSKTWVLFTWKYAVPVEEVEEEIEWKINDIYIEEKADYVDIGIITDIRFHKNGNIYINGFSWNFRKPTPEELEKYFRKD